MNARAILLDLDGTLVDSNDYHVDAWQIVLREAGFDFDRSTLHAQVGKGGDNYVPALLPDEPAELQERIASRHGEVYRHQFLPRVRPFPAASALVERLAGDGIRVVLASSASREELDHYVTLLGIGSLIHDATSKDDVAHSKPDPDIFRCALAKAGTSPSATLVVGDSPWDAVAARRAGLRITGLLSGGFDIRELQAAGADPVYADVGAILHDYPAWIARLGR